MTMENAISTTANKFQSTAWKHVPDSVKAAVEDAIAQQVAAMRAQLEQTYAERAQQHEEQIKALEAQIG